MAVIQKNPPKSATSWPVNLLALGVLFISYYLLRDWEASPQAKVVSVLALVALPIGLFDIFVFRVHRRESTGLDWDKTWELNIWRVATKLLGLTVTLSAIAFAYWLFPEYRGPGKLAFHADFYRPYWELIQRFSISYILLTLVYFPLIDGYQREPKDTYWQLGRLALGFYEDVKPKEIANHARSWLVKAYFLPLMYVYATSDINRILGWQTLSIGDWRFYDVCYTLGYSIDLVFVTFGYILSLRLFDTHIRSAEPTMLGWVVALFCYQPFFSLFDRQYVAYEAGTPFGVWFDGLPTIRAVWGFVIIVLVLIYSLSSVAFGWRFSNLTHRGILTNGPYRFTKHPAYISKNLSWWLITMPFVSRDGPVEAVRRSLLLLAINTMYFLRAKTEERHLSRDPVYVEYALWMNEHGIFRFLARWIPALQYQPPEGWKPAVVPEELPAKAAE